MKNVFLALLFLPGVVSAGTLSWQYDAAAEPSIDGYKVYADGNLVGTAGPSARQFNLSKLAHGEYKVAVTAFAGDQESASSDEVTVAVAPAPTVAPPTAIKYTPSASPGIFTPVVTGIHAARDFSLSQLGPRGWVRWFKQLHRSAGTPQTIKVEASSPPVFFNPPAAQRAATFSWANGVSPAAVNKDPGWVNLAPAGGVFTITADAGTGVSVLDLYIGALDTAAVLRAELSDGSAPPRVIEFGAPGDYQHRTIKLSFTSASADAKIKVTLTKDPQRAQGAIAFHAATLR